MKPKIVFFSRSYQAKLFPLLKSDSYESIHVALTSEDKKIIERNGAQVKYCFDEFEGTVETLEDNYLESSFVSDRFLNSKRITLRVKFLKKEVAFWRAVFDEYNPIAVLNEQVAIEIAEVMYIEAKNRDINYMAWMTNPVNGYFYWLSNPMSLTLDDSVLSSEPSKESVDISNRYINNIIKKNERPYYLNPYLNITKAKSLFGSISGLIRSYIKEKTNNKNEYEKFLLPAKVSLERSLGVYFYGYSNMDDFANYEVILYPLHYEPEASLSYLSEFFSNQVSLIENISKCLDYNQVLVVKEHPAQQGMLTTKKYRKLLKSVSNVYFLPNTVLSFDIIKKSQLIITLTSHLGWEALILGKPVFLLGKMFYDKYPNINRFITWEHLKVSIRERNYVYPTKESIVRFIAQLLDNSYKGIPFMGDDRLYEEKNIERIVKSIEKELDV